MTAPLHLAFVCQAVLTSSDRQSGDGLCSGYRLQTTKRLSFKHLEKVHNQKCVFFNSLAFL